MGRLSWKHKLVAIALGAVFAFAQSRSEASAQSSRVALAQRAAPSHAAAAR